MSLHSSSLKYDGYVRAYDSLSFMIPGNFLQTLTANTDKNIDGDFIKIIQNSDRLSSRRGGSSYLQTTRNAQTNHSDDEALVRSWAKPFGSSRNLLNDK